MKHLSTLDIFDKIALLILLESAMSFSITSQKCRLPSPNLCFNNSSVHTYIRINRCVNVPMVIYMYVHTYDLHTTLIYSGGSWGVSRVSGNWSNFARH